MNSTEDGDDVSQNFENIVKSMGAKVYWRTSILVV
jgi:hypothetical protein